MENGVLKIKAFAKINLTLDVLHKRNDGFHEVAMIMQAVDLADTVSLREQEQGITITTNVPGLACDQTNLAYRAAALLMDVCRINRGVHIALEKKIPMAAGLAGGSSDAAAVLRGINKLWQLNMPLAELEKLGAQLGSDIPFCLRGGTMLATGRGEILRPLPDMVPCFVVLAKPRVDVSTAWVYRNYRPENAVSHPDTEGMIECLKNRDLTGIAGRLCNVLENVTIPAYPEIRDIKEYMIEHGALSSLMSGSGPTVFGLVEDGRQAEILADGLRKISTAEIFIVRTSPKMEGENGAAINADKTRYL